MQMVFVDQFGRPHSEGTVLEVPSLVHHQGIVAYTTFGEQVIIHNSKKLGRAVVSKAEELNDGYPVIALRIPSTPEEGARIVRAAWADVQRGVRWAAFDNCQDFVSRAVTGQNGSKSRNFLAGAALVATLVFVIASA
jgi:hypothetical protein